jgi:hypothetical protein
MALTLATIAGGRTDQREKNMLPCQTASLWRLARLGCLAAGLMFAAPGAFATPLAYTDRAAFDAAVSGFTVGTENLDSQSAGTVISSGSAVGAISFSYNFGGVQMAVTDGTAFGGSSVPFSTTSPHNFLGTTDLDIFQDGDDFGMHFAPTNAIGLYLLSADPLIDGDFLLTVNGIAAGLAASHVQQYFADDGTSVFFLGIVDPNASFTTASLTTSHDGSTGSFLWNADDIVTARNVPEPGSLALISLALAALGARKFNPRRMS